MKTIFLTGSQGFIGSHLLPKLRETHSVYCAGYNELPEVDFDYIMHLAAVTTTSPSFLPELFESNIVYARQIMSIPTRIIYASSTSASELTNPYAYTKRYLEYLAYYKNATGLRFFNVYGPNNSKGIVKAALEKDELTIEGGLQIRDFIYIDDVVNAIIAALGSHEKIIEVGTGTGITVEHAIKIIEHVKGSPIKVNYIKSNPTDMLVSIAKPGIMGCLSFEEGIKLMINL